MKQNLFESACCIMFENEHAGFVIDFNEQIASVFENMAFTESLNTKKYILVESEDELSDDQIQSIFRSAEIVTSKDYKGMKSLSSDMVSKIKSSISGLAKKYNKLPPIDSPLKKFNKLESQLIQKALLDDNEEALDLLSQLKTKVKDKDVSNVIIGALTATIAIAKPTNKIAILMALKAVLEAIQ